MRNFIGACEVFEGVFGCRVFVHLQSGTASPRCYFQGRPNGKENCCCYEQATLLFEL
jgi:hypothetical protein